MNLKHKKIVVTGATGGIGSALAKALAAQGCQLLLTGRKKSQLKQLQAQIGTEHVFLVEADLTEVNGRAALLDAAQKFEPDMLVNCLGVNQLALLTESSEANISKMLDINLTTPIQLCQNFIPLLLQSPQPVIVNVGSILGSIGYAGSSVYCASKFGLRGFTESLRREMADTRLKVMYFAPRATNTSLNTDVMQNLNNALGNAVDEPQWVAEQLIKMLQAGAEANHYLGWPESLFVRINAVLPRLVDKFLLKQLPVIRRFAQSQSLHS